MMNFPGVLSGIDEVMDKLLFFEGKIIDGHAPLLQGRDLQGYMAAGIGSDHECLDPGEALEKVRSGACVMIREGTSARNLETLLPIVTDYNSRRFCLVSDDLHAEDVLCRGHLDYTVRKAISLGLSPAQAVSMASLNPCEYFGLLKRGAVAPGYLADLIVLSDLHSFEVEAVYKKGLPAVMDGRLITEGISAIKAFPQTFRCGEITSERLKIRHGGGKARVIEIIPGQLVTKKTLMDVPAVNGLAVSDTASDILKLCVIERHKGSGNTGLGFVKGFGLKKGAIASSVAHDSHNLIAVGVEDKEIRLAMETVRDMKGGVAVVAGDMVLARIPLPIAGLMSEKSLDAVVEEIRRARKSCKEIGSLQEDPIMALSFLALPVIPELKLTDVGLIDVGSFKVVPLFTN
jgi:adenine deaminase